jgi:hypothetical protein
MLSSFCMIPPTPVPYLEIMLLRPAEPADAMAVARVHVRSWQAAYSTLLPAEYLDQLRPEDRAQRSNADSSIFGQNSEIPGPNSPPVFSSVLP